MKGVTNTVTAFLLMTMVLLILQAVVAMESAMKPEYSIGASSGRAGALADNMAVAIKVAYAKAGFNISTRQPGIVAYSESFPPQYLANLSGNLNSVSALFNSTSAPDYAAVSFQQGAGKPQFNIAPLNATLSYDSENYTRITPIDANYSSALVKSYNVSVAANCSSFSHSIMNISNSSSDKLRLRIDLHCSQASPFTMIYDVDRNNLTQIWLYEGNQSIVGVNVTSPAKLEVFKGRGMALNITAAVAADVKVEVPSSYSLSAGGFNVSGAVRIE